MRGAWIDEATGQKWVQTFRPPKWGPDQRPELAGPSAKFVVIECGECDTARRRIAELEAADAEWEVTCTNLSERLLEAEASLAALEAAIGTHRDVVLNQSEYDPTSDDVALWAALEGVSDE